MLETNPPNEKDKAGDSSKEKDIRLGGRRTTSLPLPVTLAEPSLQAIIEGVIQRIRGTSNISQVKEPLPSSS